MTQRSVIRQSKLAVQAPVYGERGETRVSVSPNAPSLAHGRQLTSLFAAPYLGPVAFTEFANSAYVKTSRLCHTASWSWVRGTRLGKAAHSMCIVGRREKGLVCKQESSLLALRDGTFHVRRLTLVGYQGCRCESIWIIQLFGCYGSRIFYDYTKYY